MWELCNVRKANDERSITDGYFKVKNNCSAPQGFFMLLWIKPQTPAPWSMVLHYYKCALHKFECTFLHPVNMTYVLLGIQGCWATVSQHLHCRRQYKASVLQQTELQSNYTILTEDRCDFWQTLTDYIKYQYYYQSIWYISCHHIWTYITVIQVN